MTRLKFLNLIALNPRQRGGRNLGNAWVPCKHTCSRAKNIGNALVISKSK